MKSARLIKGAKDLYYPVRRTGLAQRIKGGTEP